MHWRASEKPKEKQWKICIHLGIPSPLRLSLRSCRLKETCPYLAPEGSLRSSSCWMTYSVQSCGISVSLDKNGCQRHTCEMSASLDKNGCQSFCILACELSRRSCVWPSYNIPSERQRRVTLSPRAAASLSLPPSAHQKTRIRVPATPLPSGVLVMSLS